MIQTGDETDAALTESMCTAKVQIGRSQISQDNQILVRKENIYPVLAQLAAKYLCMLAASVASERLFSTAKHIISGLLNSLDLQNSLDPERAEMLLFMYKYVRTSAYLPIS